jgi:hypothetical protein
MSDGKVFLSYASADRARVEALVRTLEGQGLDVWWDRDIPRGKNFSRVIEEALQQAQCAVVIWSHASIASEWVFNEASDARKRGILVPVLIDNVEPPLEFRHLQAAKLFGWKGDPADEELAGLLDAVRGLVQQPGTSASRIGSAPLPVRAKHWWQTPAGMALGGGALLVGVSVFLIALKQIGLIGGAPDTPAATVSPAGAPPAVVQAPAAAQAPPATPTATAVQAKGGGEAGGSTGRTNLLDPEEGGKLVLASEESWKHVMERKLGSNVIGTHGFAVFAFRDEKPATIDAVGVFVEGTDRSNLKELTIYASDQSETGPFRKVASLTLPNYRNMRAPFHEFKVDPFTARYAKIELMSWQNSDGPNGYVGNMQLLGALQ